MSGAAARRRRWARAAARPPATAGVKSEINVTPLVDVVLVLLIIFMVVTPMLTRGLAVDLPLARHPAKKNDGGRQLVVSVTRDGRVHVDADAVPADQVPERLRAALDERARGGAREVHLKGDRALTYGEVRRVLQQLHEAGATQVALGTEEPEKGGAR